MADLRPVNILSLCTGGGGLDLGVELAVPGARTICGVEWDASSCAYLAGQMAQGTVAPFPVWSDLRTFDGAAWRGCVDILVAGYPCPPFSVAGKQLGEEDPRHLWPHVACIIDECRPPIVFLENVSGHLRLGAHEVCRDLQDLGYSVACGLFSAEEVGAPHKRERLFILAVRHADGEAGDEEQGVLQTVADPAGVRCELADAEHLRPRAGGAQREAGSRIGRSGSPDDGAELAHADGFGRRKQGDEGESPARLDRGGCCVADARSERPQGHGAARAEAWTARRSGGAEVADADSFDCEGRTVHARQGSGGGGAADAGWPIWPPGPGDLDAWRDIDPRLWPSAEPGVRPLAHGLARRHLLRIYGNGVVPLVAAHTFRTLARELEEIPE